MSRASKILLACLLASCDGSATELVVVVDSDLAVPVQLDAVSVEITGVAGAQASGTLTGSGAEPLPRYVGVVHGGGSLGPLEVRATGSRNGNVIVERRARTSFVAGRTLTLYLFLSRNCLNVTCAEGETCDGGSCVSAEVPASSLPTWNGTIDRIDAGTCMIAAAETCNNQDDDCDGMVDETFSLSTDAFNCGACGRSCARTNAMVACVAGACQVTGCEPNTGNCDSNAVNGCETDLLNTAAHCTACNMRCTVPNAMASCTNGVCGVATCNAGYGDCDAAMPGCETRLNSLTHCGDCNVPCTIAGASESCTTGQCLVQSCDDPLLGECDGDMTTICETPINTLAVCGACNTPCDLAHATGENCDTGTCLLGVCDGGFEDCDTMASTGCEHDISVCGTCGTACVLPSATGTCRNSRCEVLTCAADRGDCDLDPANGCEVDHQTDINDCGVCGRVCAVRCRNGACQGG